MPNSLMSAGGRKLPSYSLEMRNGPGIGGDTVTTVTFHTKGTFHITGSHSAGWLCNTTITCKGVQRGYSENGGSGTVDFIVDVVPNDKLVIKQTTDYTNSGNRANYTSLSIVQTK